MKKFTFFSFIYLFGQSKMGVDISFVMVYNKIIKKCEGNVVKIYENSRNHRKIFSNCPLPTKSGDYLYFLRIGNSDERVFKIGTTNRPLERLQEHLRAYKTDVEVLWFSPAYEWLTTLRVERKQKDYWIENMSDWKYINNDRFFIPEDVDEIVITVKKEYKIKLR